MTSGTALLLIDLQVGLLAGEQPVFEAAAVLERCAALATRARASAVPVVYVQDKDVGEGVGTPGWEIHPAVASAPGDLVLRKAWGDSFYETSLRDELAVRGITRLVIAGLKSDSCVFMTSTRAVALGYDVTLAADAHSTSDNHIINAQQARDYITALLEGIGTEDGFGQGQHSISVAPAAEIAL